jgi:hypothetical protein
MNLKVVGWLNCNNMKKEDGLLLLKEIIKEEKRHEDYKRVTLLADKYYAMKTGDGIEEMLHKIETRVTDEEFKQIKKIYKSIIPSTLNSTKLPFQKALRKQPLVRQIDYGGDAEAKKIELEKFIQTYWGDKSLEEYLEYAYVDYNYIDPNAFLVTEFDNFDNKQEKAQPYPFVASSTEAVMFKYNNEILDYLVVKLPTKYRDGDIEKEGVKYTMYLGYDTIVCNQVAESKATEYLANRWFEVLFYEPKNEKVPAMRFGYIRDEQTKGRTFVSLFHCVIGLLEKTLKIDSELDLSTSMVAFPQRFRYVTPCNNPGCKNGYLLDGNMCSVCQGTGIQPYHKGTQDVVSLNLPKDPTKMIDLEQMAYDHSPDIELLQFDSDYLEKLEKKVWTKMFNNDMFTKAEVQVTATHDILDTDNLNDTLYPFGRNYSAIWEFVVYDIATFTDLNNGLELQHKFPNDFKFKTLSELMEELKIAKDASASTSTIAAIEDDINEILYSDRPEALKQIRIKNQINPFRGYSEANIRFIISQGNVPKYQRALWENFESIFSDLENETKGVWFYDLAYDEIVKRVKAKAQEYMTLIDTEKKADMEQFAEQEQNNKFAE